MMSEIEMSCQATEVRLYNLAKEIPEMYSTIMLVVVALGSLIFLVSGLKNRGKTHSTLEILTGLFGLVFVGLDFYWHMGVAFSRLRGLAIAYYVAWHFSGGVAAAMLLYVSRLMSARTLVIASTVFLVMANLFLIPRHRYAFRSLCLAEGLFAGLLIASLTLIWFEHHRRQVQP